MYKNHPSKIARNLSYHATVSVHHVEPPVPWYAVRAQCALWPDQYSLAAIHARLYGVSEMLVSKRARRPLAGCMVEFGQFVPFPCNMFDHEAEHCRSTQELLCQRSQACLEYSNCQLVLTCRSDNRWRKASNREQALAGSVAALDKEGSKMSASSRSISRARDSRA